MQRECLGTNDDNDDDETHHKTVTTTTVVANTSEQQRLDALSGQVNNLQKQTDDTTSEVKK